MVCFWSRSGLWHSDVILLLSVPVPVSRLLTEHCLAARAVGVPGLDVTLVVSVQRTVLRVRAGVGSMPLLAPPHPILCAERAPVMPSSFWHTMSEQACGEKDKDEKDVRSLWEKGRRNPSSPKQPTNQHFQQNKTGNEQGACQLEITPQDRNAPMRRLPTSPPSPPPSPASPGEIMPYLLFLFFFFNEMPTPPGLQVGQSAS